MRYFTQFDVQILGSPAQDVESLISRDPLTFHQNPFGLSDYLAGAQGQVEVVSTTIFIFTGACSRKGDAGQRGQKSSLDSVGGIKASGIAGLETKDSRPTKWYGEHIVHSCR